VPGGEGAQPGLNQLAGPAQLRERLFELALAAARWWPTWTRSASLIRPGWPRWSARANRAAAHGGSLHVVCARPRIRQLFRLTGLDRRLAPARTLDEALDAVMTARRPPG